MFIAHPHCWVFIQKISLSSRARKKQKAKNELKLLESYLVAKWTEEIFFVLTQECKGSLKSDFEQKSTYVVFMPTCDLICTKDLNKFSDVAFTVEPRPSGPVCRWMLCLIFSGWPEKNCGFPKKIKSLNRVACTRLWYSWIHLKCHEMMCSFLFFIWKRFLFTVFLHQVS